MPVPQKIDPNDIDSAIDSWSGFIYQGKVAIFHALYLLNNDREAPTYSLQLDSIDDFAILNDDESVKSIHQVKAMKSALYSSYREAFEKLERRVAQFPCERACFHLAVQNEDSSAQIIAKHPTIEIYRYGNNEFCTLEEVDARIEDEIGTFLSNARPAFNNAHYRKIVREAIEDILVGQVIAVHANNHQSNGLNINEGAYYFVIPLQNILDVLNSDLNAAGVSEDYFLFLTKKLLNIYYQNYCVELQERGPVSDELKQKLSKYLVGINGLAASEFAQFVRNIMPHRQFKLSSVFDFKDNNINQDEFCDAFLESLASLTEIIGTIKDNFTWKCRQSQLYAPTTINYPNDEIQRMKLCKRLYSNFMNSDVSVPFNTNVLVTSAAEIDSLGDALNNTTHISAERNGNITKWENVGLKSYHTVGGLL